MKRNLLGFLSILYPSYHAPQDKSTFTNTFSQLPTCHTQQLILK